MIEYYNRLPNSVLINNKRVPINSDYRIFINFETEMQGKDTKKAIYKALSSFYPNFFYICNSNMLDEAIEKFVWFYLCGQEKQYKFQSKKNKKKAQQVFSYQYDGDLICGSFYMYAKVDLHKYCHWWRFKEIWNSLPTDCEFCKIKSYRAYDGKDKDMLELKEYYKLPPTEAEIQEQIRKDKIYEAFK